MRDAYVDIPGYGSAKLNAAYSYGGAELLMDTIEYNYKIAIDSYISVSFVGFADIIDAVGGIKVTVSDSEADALNVILQSEVNEIMGDDVNSDLLSGGGTYTLNGKQALSYSRIRYVGNADFERTERQRNVMEQVVSKLKSMNPVYFTKILGNAVPELTTNMSTPDLYLFSLRIPTMIFYKSEQQQVPADGTWSDATINGESVLQVDFDANIKILEETVFG
jgi:LCP family protein required for cell wall assembly